MGNVDTCRDTSKRWNHCWIGHQKHAGSVRKGFGLIFGLFLSGVLQAQLAKDDGGVTLPQIVGGILAALSLYMHSKFPVCGI